MKIQINSKQNYGTHTEEMKEEYDSQITEEKETLTIEFKNGKIKGNNKKIIYQKNKSTIIIELNQTNKCEYNTPYGKIFLEITGQEIEIKKQPLNIKIKYQISAKGIPPYTNEVEIQELHK